MQTVDSLNLQLLINPLVSSNCSYFYIFLNISYLPNPKFRPLNIPWIVPDIPGGVMILPYEVTVAHIKPNVSPLRSSTGNTYQAFVRYE